LINLIKNELVKMAFQRKFLFFLCLIAALILAPVLFTFISRFKIHDGQTYPLFFLGTMTSLVLPIFISIITADSFTEEYVSGSLSTILIHPVTRFQVLTAKVISLYMATVFVLLYTMFLAYAAGTLFFGWGEAFLDRGITYTAAEGAAITAGSYLLASLPLLAFTLVVMLLALVLHSTSAVVGLSIGIVIVFSLAGLIVTELQPYLITSYFNALGEAVMIAKDRLETLKALAMIAAYGFIPFGLSTLIFKKRNLLY
jgi:ABC-2 type transport system permease protein